MKERFLCVLLAMSLLAVSGCAEQKSNSLAEQETEQQCFKDTPVRVGGPGVIMARYMWLSLEAHIEQADLVLEVTIEEWIGETPYEVKYGDELIEMKRDSCPNTYYRAKVNHTFKGSDKSYDTIVVKQSGNSGFRVNDDVLFKNGDRVILFLREFDYELHEKENNVKILPKFNDTFIMSHWFTTNFYIWEYEGKNYVISLYSGGILNDQSERGNIKPLDEKIAEAIAENFFTYDEIYKETADKFGYNVFEYDDVVKLILEGGVS